MGILKTKFQEEMQHRGQFSIVPNEIHSRNLNIKYSCRMVWIYLLSQGSTWECSRNNISKNIGLSKDKVSEFLKALEKRKMISISVEGPSNKWHVEIYPPSEWIYDMQEEAGPALGPDLLEEEDSPVLEVKASLVKTPTYKKTRYTKLEIEENKPSSEEIYKSWKASLPDKLDFKACYDELLSLFATLRSKHLKESDISSSLRKKIMARWSRSKYPANHEEAWDRASGSIWAVQLSEPKVIKSTITKYDGKSISIDDALNMVTDDDEIAKIVADNKRLMESIDE